MNVVVLILFLMEVSYEKKHIENFLMILSLLVFCIITITRLMNHTPWFDEAHTWRLANYMNFHNILTILHNEGHFIVWYSVLMPFAKLNLFYPYPLKFSNWLFYFLAIFLMWKKAPFYPVAKALVTFSWISLYYFSINARCYSIGILGLFILASLYKEQTKHPIIYSLIIVLTAHTSLLATFAVIPLALIFLSEIIKILKKENKFQYNIPLIILVTGVVLWFLPFLNGLGHTDLLANNPPRIDVIINLFKRYKCLLGISYTVCCLMIFCYADNKIRFFLFTAISLFILFFKLFYSVYYQHAILLYIYLIIAFWLTPKLHKRNISSYIFLISFTILLNLNLNKNFHYMLNNSNKTHIVNYINEQNIDYVFTTWRYADIRPLVLAGVQFPVYDEYSVRYKKDETYIKNYIFDALKNDSNNWKAISLTSHRVNDSSIQYFWGINKVPNTLYITEFSKLKN